MATKRELRALITLAGKIDPSLQAAMMKAAKMNMNMVQQSRKSVGMMSSVWNIAKGVFAGNLMTRGFSMLTNAIKSVAAQGTELASDLTEVQNVVDTTFGQSSKQIDEWAGKALEKFGLSELQAKQFTGTLGAMLKSSGISSKYLVQMSENLAGLAGDFASFYNLDHEEAFNKIRAGISGETEPLKALGINMSVANLEAFAMSKGIKTAYKDMDQASQTMLRYAYLLEVSKDAQGDFAKTLDTSYANQKRLLTTNFQQMMANLASKSLPVLTKGIKLLNEYISKINVDKISQAIADKLGGAFSLIEKYGPVVIDTIKYVGSNIFNAAKMIVSQVIPIIQRLGDVLYSAFDYAKPRINWLINDGIPVVTGAISELLGMATNLCDYIVNNWSAIEPIVWGIVGALVANKIAMWGMIVAQKAGMIITALSKAWAVGTTVLAMFRSGASLATIAQWALNAAMAANPIGILIVAIGALVAAGVALYKNWDKVSSFFASSWEWIKKAFATGVNWIIDKINWLIDKINLIPGVEIPLIPKIQTQNVSFGEFQAYQMKEHALGGFSDKPAIFGEAGLEAAIPIKYKSPRSISLLNQTAKMIGAEPLGDMPPISLTFNFYGPVSNKEEVTSGVQAAKEYIFEVLDEYYDGRRRVAFG